MVTLRGLGLFFVILATANTAFADAVYVSDTRRVNIYQRPSASSPILAVVVSGTKLSILETKGRYTRIRTNDDIQGWVRSAYLTKDAPAQTKLDRLHEQYSALEGKLRETKQKLDEINQKDPVAIIAINEDREDSSSTLFWVFVSVTAVTMLVGGFLAGIQWYKHRISKKLGGFRF
ncbi:MAG TPA: TIGR04211 family SH3 domain-containing protein [Acidiferrobacteraceae bacterium]|nr:TIGR04211 family SH3 domain-containing protein [Acidiferrobacteraceae bacterium]